MRLLWLGASETEIGEGPPGEFAQFVAARVLAARTGAAVELITRKTWPAPELPAIVDRWVERLEPDLVCVFVSSFPFCYASVPIRLRHAWGRFGRKLGEAGATAIGEGWLPRNPVFGAARWAARHTVGASAFFEPEAVLAVYEEVLTVLLRHEHVGVVMRNVPRPVYVEAGRDVAEARRRAVFEGIATYCARTHIPCIDPDAGRSAAELLALRARDRLHFSALGHAVYGAAAGEALAAVALGR
ncbi:MAG: SGNH/GDSL hydrolase family protein [Chloroflexi bacterium]|nr:SGNH/GDSL hydrolase family protein [Chloroflexota bacterium]